MRTTLTLSEDMYLHAKAIAKHEDRSLGEVVSDMMRASIRKPSGRPVYRNGIRVMPSRGGPPVTLELVNRLRDELP